jgi:6-phosphofructokinase 1
MAKRKIGILTSGGDCPGLNATIRGAVLACQHHMGEDNVEFIGIYDGYSGLINNQCKPLDLSNINSLLTQGGTMLGSKRTPFKKMGKIEEDEIDKVSQMKKTYEEWRFDCVLALGGKGSHKNANLLSQEGLNVIGLPKTIDNDIFGTDVTFGFHSAVEIGTEVIDRIHTTAASHGRVMVIEIMGNKTGWLALYAGIAGGSNAILIPEIPYNEDKLVEFIRNRADEGKSHSIIVVAEGAMDYFESLMKKKEREKKRLEKGEKTVTNRIVNLIQEKAGLEARSVVPGHMLRGGVPSGYDRLLSTEFGAKAALLIKEEKYGYTIAKKGNVITENRLEDMAGKNNYVNAECEEVTTARNIGVCFGD